MLRPRCTGRRLRVATVAALLLVLCAGPVAGGQGPKPPPSGASPTGPEAPARETGPIDESTIADPSATVPGTTAPPQGDARPATGTGPTAAESTTRRTEAVEDTPPAPTNPTRRTLGFGNAAQQPQSSKQREARADCVPDRPPVSPMLGLAGTVTVTDHKPWGWLALAVAAAASLLAFAAFRLRRQRGGAGDPRPPRGVLETVATVVGVCGGILGLVVQFFPGIVGAEPPAPEATMAVREVHARITRGEYARQTRARVALSDINKREVGNVVWLEIGLRGYRGRRPHLQYGLYDPDLGGALLSGTAKEVPLSPRGDVQKLFVPVWVGYPKSQRFEAEFRLLEEGEVRQMASTGRMRSSRYRYACTRSSS